jgi:hypothetical protein
MPQLRWAAALRPWRKLRAACSRGAAAAQRRGGVGGARAGGARRGRTRSPAPAPRPRRSCRTTAPRPTSTATRPCSAARTRTSPAARGRCVTGRALLRLRRACPPAAGPAAVPSARCARSRLTSCFSRPPLVLCPDRTTSSHSLGRVSRRLRRSQRHKMPRCRWRAAHRARAPAGVIRILPVCWPAIICCNACRAPCQSRGASRAPAAAPGGAAER